MIYSENLPPVVGVDIGGAQARAALLKNTLSQEVNVSVTEGQRPEDIIKNIHKAVEEVLKRENQSINTIGGIGIGVPGPANSKTGQVFFSSNLTEWDGVALQSRLQELFNPAKPPIFVDNDANASALGEYIFGAGRGTSNMIYLTISTGIGGGIIVNGEIMRGAHGNAAEIGHMCIQYKSSEYCSCGNAGCLESIASGRAIYERVKEIDSFQKHLHNEGIDEQWVFRVLRSAANYMEYDADIRRIISDAEKALGIGLVNLIHIFNPEKIILGGSVNGIFPQLVDTAKQIVVTTTTEFMRIPRTTVEILSPKLGDKVGLIGAGALVYYQLRLLK